VTYAAQNPLEKLSISVFRPTLNDTLAIKPFSELKKATKDFLVFEKGQNT
jgi:hypothetical protein